MKRLARRLEARVASHLPGGGETRIREGITGVLLQSKFEIPLSGVDVLTRRPEGEERPLKIEIVCFAVHRARGGEPIGRVRGVPISRGSGMITETVSGDLRASVWR